MSKRSCPECGSFVYATDQNCAEVPTTYCCNPDCNWFADPTIEELNGIGYSQEQYQVALETFNEEK